MPTSNNHNHSSIGSTIREVVFGIEDGMVSTLGAITGIAIGSKDLYTVVLAGVVIISVESISMGIGSYLANRTEYDVNRGRLSAKKKEIDEKPHDNKMAMEKLFVKDGWSKKIADEMSSFASGNKQLMLKELSYRELHFIEESAQVPFKNAIFMYFSYIIGGLIPLFAYLILPVSKAMPISIVVTLLGLFLLGVATTKYTKELWIKAGFRILIFGATALVVGFIVGDLVARFN